ncbi:hypothetical protein I6F26_00345 [Ensifer sp. IC3342]|nr:hypothetical protein [Ensifer sp. BRP08]MCA1445044.1 hypothetical protein [Ensifer sp. IC3342]
MKYALVEGGRREATPSARGECPGCGEQVIAKCGTMKIAHWAHASKRNCDHWWEPETEWHRNWKNEFPDECQEIRHTAADGELHIADVRTVNGSVLEFQHSNISPHEREARERFYERMVWVADGTRLKRDLPGFQDAIGSASRFADKPICMLVPTRSSSIVQRWAGGRCPVYLDFGSAEFDVLPFCTDPVLWKLQFRQGNGLALVMPVSRSSFVDHHRGSGSLRGYRTPQLNNRRRSRF